MSAIHNTLSHCVKCAKCMKTCPIDAIHFINNRAVINETKCIDCGRCIEICTHNGIYSLTSSLDEIKNYRYTCVLVPTALYSQFTSKKEVLKCLKALQLLGFDEVIDLSYYAAGVMNTSVEYVSQYESGVLISSHCPVITRLISKKYPTLLSSIIPINYTSEITAKEVRQRVMHETGLESHEIGIFLLAECAGKIGLAKHPLQVGEFEVDHAISIHSITTPLRQAMNKVEVEEDASIEFAKYGLLYALKDGVRRILKDYSVINVDGIEKAIDVLELAEFDRLKGIRFINMSSCYNGCVGGNFLWNNPFTARIQLEEYLKEAAPIVFPLTFEKGFHEMKNMNEQDVRTMKEKIEWFAKIESIYETLPGIDCGACGFPSCRHMAEEIAKGNRQSTDCRIK